MSIDYYINLIQTQNNLKLLDELLNIAISDWSHRIKPLNIEH